MSRQLEQKQEQRETAKRDALFQALEHGLPGALAFQGIELLGFAIKYGDFDCLMTIKAYVGETRSVCFVGSDTMTNCILKADAEARRGALKWRKDKYHKD
jgi:hypothetical protein